MKDRTISASPCRGTSLSICSWKTGNSPTLPNATSSIPESPANLALMRTIRNSMSRRVHCRPRPKSEVISTEQMLDAYSSTERPTLAVDNIFAAYAKTFDVTRKSEMSVGDYLDVCRDGPMMYACHRAAACCHWRDTAKDARLGRILMNRTIRIYPAQ